MAAENELQQVSRLGRVRSRVDERYDGDSWRSKAACADVDPDLFFPVGAAAPAQEQTSRAKAVCAGCPVHQPCLAFALATNQQFGIWGGFDEEERRDIRRQMRRSMRHRRLDEAG